MPSDRERIKQLEEQMRDVEDRHATWLEGYTTLANRVNELRKGELYVNSMIAAICLILGEKDPSFAEELREKAKALMDAAASSS